MGRLCSSRYERASRKLGWTRIAGLDEAGRGALFCPVVAAAVILNPKRRIVGLDDSKKLTPDRREELAPRIKENSVAWAVAEIDAQDLWQRATVAAVTVSSSHSFAEKVLRSVEDEAAALLGAELADATVEWLE